MTARPRFGLFEQFELHGRKRDKEKPSHKS